MTLITSITAKAAIFVILTAETLVPSAEAKCIIRPTRNPDAVKPCRQIAIADYTPPDNGHPDGTHGSGTRLTRVSPDKDPRDSQPKNHPLACDRFEAKSFQQLNRPLDRGENRWFRDFQCPSG